MKQLVLAITGASGAPYAQRLLQMLARYDLHLHVIITPIGRRILMEELALRPVTLADLAGRPLENATLYTHRDLGARLASGSFLTEGMVICPCSSQTLAAVANGLADNLVTRAALVTLKEARRLILVPREMPLSAIELENMLRISRGGGIVCPACPGFYLRPAAVGDLVDFVVGRILDLLGLPHALNTRWVPPGESGAAAEATDTDE